MGQDFYYILGLTRDASAADIHKQYRRLALKYHPTLCQERNASFLFTQIAEAYSVLCRDDLRAVYDRFGESVLRRGVTYQGEDGTSRNIPPYIYHGDPHKVFHDFFGGDNPFSAYLHGGDEWLRSTMSCHCCHHRSQAELVKLPPIERDLYLSLEELYRGGEVTIRVIRKVLSGDGLSVEVEDKNMDIEVKPGWCEGTGITFTDAGNQEPLSIPGDLVLLVKETCHPVYERHGDHLHFTSHITLDHALSQAVVVDITTLDNRTLHVPVCDIITPSYVKVVVGEGMPVCSDVDASSAGCGQCERARQKGNLYIHFNITFPERLSERQRSLLKQALRKQRDGGGKNIN